MQMICNGMAYNLNENTGDCYILTNFSKTEDGKILFKEKINYNNPLVAWNFFTQNVEFHGKTKIRKILEKQGKNPMTGEKNG